MSNENLLHVKLFPKEAIQSKRDIISSKINLLEILESMRNYYNWRIKELEMKSILYKKIKELSKNISNFKKILPKIEVPKEKRIEKEESYEIKGNEDLEIQLQRLEEELKSLAKE